MSYLINPINFDDQKAVNTISSFPSIKDFFIQGKENIVDAICADFQKGVILVDGHITADLADFAAFLFEKSGANQLIHFESFLRSSNEIEALVADCLPQDRNIDPELIYGKLFNGSIEDFIDFRKVDGFISELNPEAKTVIYGHGCLLEQFIKIATKTIFIDLTPKDAAIRINQGKYTNIGCKENLDFDSMARRTYFVDVEIISKIRRNAIAKNMIDTYILESCQGQYTSIDPSALRIMLNEICMKPFRPKPVYIDGVWGGQFIKKIRHIPDQVASKVAWSFELIASEASVAFEVNSQYLDIPFVTIMDMVGKDLIGEKLFSRFNGYFPIRFNYDDTWHSNGNMSIQCHPTDEMARRIHGDYAGQSEAYYVVITGHDAKTFFGFKSDADSREFLRLCKQSEITGKSVPYKNYINAIDSKPGRQIFIPAGTVHGSGRNQVVLELGSLTINAYTYKIYDYNRKDDNGKLRPIHTNLAEEALAFNRDENWVKENVAFDPILIDKQADYQEYLIGRNDLMYFETYKLCIKSKGTYFGHNSNGFCVITLVDGEEIEIRSIENPDYKFIADYLDVVVVPAGVKDFIIEVKGKQPVVLQKAVVRV